MEKFKVSFEANNQQLKSIGTKHASDTYADIEATFVLGEKWTDMDSVSAVWWNDFTRVATVLDSQGKCVVPHEVLTRKGCVRVNLVGSIVEGDELITRLTSYSAEAVQVNEKIKLTGSETSEITPSQYEQFVANVKADADRAETVRDEAEAARDVAVSAKDTAVNAVEGFEDIVDTATATAVQTIQGEGATQVTAIQTEGTTQVASVRTEGSTQVTAVQDKGDEVLDSIPADYTQLSQNVTDLKSDINEIASLNYVTIDKSASVLTEYPTQGYINNDTGAFSAYANYYCYYFTMPETCDVWFDTQTVWGQIAVYDGDIFDADALVSIGALSRNTLPYADSKLNVARGMKVVICISTADFNFHYADRMYIADGQVEYVGDALKVNGITDNEVFNYTKHSPELTEYATEGYPSSDDGGFRALANYHSYSMPITKDSEIWFDAASAPNWIQIAVYKGTIFDTSKWLGTYGINKGNLPTVNSKLSVSAGVNIVVCVSNNDFKMHITNDSDFVISDEQIAYISKKIKGGIVTLSKISPSGIFVSVPIPSREKSVVYEFEKCSKTWSSLDYVDEHGVTQQATNVVSANLWNNSRVLDDSGNNIAQGNSNFIVKTTDADYHCGDGHGNEVIEYIDFICDGASIDVDAMSVGDTVDCADFRMIQRTKVYKVGGCVSTANTYDTNYPALDTSGNPIVYFKHFLEMHISDKNEIDIDNKLLVMSDGISFSQCHGAMLQCNYGDFSEVICNNNEETRNIVASDGTVTIPDDSTINLVGTSQKCNRVEMYGGDFYIRQEMHQDSIERVGKTRVLFHDYGNRLKAYFQPVIAEFGILSGESIERFNTGDSISVSDYRKIELY